MHLRAALVLWIAPSLVIAGNWTGALVDAKCYAAEQRNKSPTNTDSDVNTDKDAEVHYCRANAKTRDFAVVDFDGFPHALDAAGNGKAAEFVRAHPSKSGYRVEVMGEKSGAGIQVTSIRPVTANH
ncbi:MAG TPA: hypothetical protein VMG40_03405 [Bryobacteraceae bacterium]|nr:hypothetical protein [Bryobacteraceae bacterium]